MLPPKPTSEPPWNALEVFEPVPFARLWELATGESIAPEDTPVKTRQHPGYETVGLRNGPWMFYPSLSVGSEFDSNVFASNTDKKSDLALLVHPSLRVLSLWEKHQIALQADVTSAFYRRFSGLDYTDASIKGRGRIDLWNDAVLLTSFRAAALNEGVGGLSSPAGAVQPTPYNLLSGDITYRQQFNRLTASLGTRLDSYDYGSTVAQNGTIIDQSSRDGQVYVGHGRLDYVVSPMLGAFTALELNKRNIRGTPGRPLDSDGFRTLTGVNLEFTSVLSGEIGVGYARQRFDSASIGTIEGPTYRALLTWSPTRTVDVKFKAEQLVTQASDTGATGIRADALQLGMDYEFRRNVVFSIAGTLERDTFFGQPRRDNVFSSMTELKYLLSRYSSVAFRHRYVSRDSNIASFTYDKHEVGIHATVQY